MPTQSWEEKLVGTLPVGLCPELFARSVSPRAFFLGGAEGDFAVCPWDLVIGDVFVVLSVCRVSVVLTVPCDLCVALVSRAVSMHTVPCVL